MQASVFRTVWNLTSSLDRVSSRTASLVRLTFICLALSVCAAAQTATTGLVQGTVTDPQGAVLPGVEVKLVDRTTNQSRVEVTNDEGLYTFVNVPPGSYSITITKQGFRTSQVADFPVEVNKSYTFPIRLEVGQATEIVTVQADAGAELQTTDAQVGNVIGTRMLRQLPTLTRNTTELLLLQPTTTPGGFGSGGTVSGARSDQNTLILDGIDVSDNLAGGQGVAFTQAPVGVDAVSEFRATVANPSASFGRSAGGQISLVSTRGGNDFHGVVYWYHQNDNLNANSWTNNRTRIARRELKDNRGGFSVNGPIWKDHTFFSGNYEVRRFPQFAAVTRTVPTASVRSGILRFADATGAIISYPLATVALCGPAGNLPCDPRGLGISPTVAALYAALPAGNDTSLGDGLNTTGWRGVASTSLTQDQVTARFDHKITDKLQLMARYSYFRDLTPSSQIDVRDPNNVGLLRALNRRGANVIAGLDYTITSNLVNSFHFGWVRNKNDLRGQGPFSVAALLNLPGTTTSGGGMTAIDIGAFNEPIDVAAQQARTQIIEDKNIQYSDNVFWNKGTHSFSFGGEFRSLPMTFSHDDQVTFLTGPISAVSNGNFLAIPDVNRPRPCATGVTTNCLPAAQATAWNTLYAATLGMIDNVGIVGARDGNLQPLPFGSDLETVATLRYYQFFFQDTWRKSSSLTLTFGLNYSWVPPPTEKLDRLTFVTDLTTNEVLSAESYLEAKRRAAEQGQTYNPTLGVRPISDSNRDSLFDTDFSNLAPRLAVAWNPSKRGGWLGSLMGDRKTVVRGGFAITYDRVNTVTVILPPAFGLGFGQVLQNPAPLCTASGTPGAGCNPTGGNPGFSAFRIGRDGVVPLPAFAGSSSPIVPPGNRTSVSYATDPNRKVGRNYMLDFTIQRELPASMILEVGYIGRFGRELPTGIDLMSSPYFFKDSASGQTYAQAHDALALQLRAGTAFSAVTNQPWFENQLAGLNALSASCRPPSVPVALSPTQCMARLLGTSFVNNSVGALFLNMDSFRIALGRQPYNAAQFAALLMATSGGRSNYNAAFVTLRNRPWHGLQFDLNYTLSRALDQVGDVQNNLSIISTGFDRNVDYGFSQADRTHVINGIFTYDLPFGNGRQWFSGGGWQDKVFGGWYLSGIYRTYSGLPFFVTDNAGVFGHIAGAPADGAIPRVDPGTLGAGVYSGITGSGGIGTSGNPASGGTGLNLFADPAAAYNSFRRTLISQDTRQGRAMAFRGPWFWNLDFRLAKSTRITEKYKFELSADFFNVFNHPNLTTAALTLNSPQTFGVISGPANSARTVQIGMRFEF